MAEARRGKSAEERLARLQRDQARVRRERLQRELAGPGFRRMLRVVPVLFRSEGALHAARLTAPAEAIVEALRSEAVFGVDTALRLAHGFGFLAADDVHAYLRSPAPLLELAAAGLIDAVPHDDTVLVRPWPGPPRLLACVVRELPAWRVLEGGHRVVGAARLRQELVGAVGARTDLFALLERAEAGEPASGG